MKRTVATTLLVLAIHAGQLGGSVQAAGPPVANSTAVELPPMMVEESVSSVPWLYVNTGGIEFLSRCSNSVTRELAEAWLAKTQLMHLLVPEEFLERLDTPAVFVLYAQDLKMTVSAEIQRELQSANDQRRRSDSPSGGRFNIAPNMRLRDRDMHASIAYIDEALFDASTLSLTSNHVRFLLTGRVPELPPWLVDGIERTWRSADFLMAPITLRPLVWNNSGESDALASDPTFPRALLPANELFGNNAMRAAESRNPRHAEARAATQDLFFRWAIVSSQATREALWKFAARADEGPVTEEIFEACFGFDFSELRDRLSDYLPKAVEATEWIDPGKLPAMPEIDVQRATPNQIARVRGEWERLAILHVQRRLPQAREPYIAQARRTLRRAYDAGDRDPRLLATMGLCEIDAGNEAGALEFLEPAIAVGVVRPRAYYEVARLRFAELRRNVPDTKLISFGDLAPIIYPLQRAVTQAPPLPEVFALLADAWARCEIPPSTAEIADMEKGARLFARQPAVVLPIARALALHGRKVQAAALLDATASNPTDDNTRASITSLRAELAPALGQPQAAKGTTARP